MRLLRVARGGKMCRPPAASALARQSPCFQVRSGHFGRSGESPPPSRCVPDRAGSHRPPLARLPYLSMHERIRDELLGRWGRIVAARPRLTLGLCLLIALIAILLTVWRPGLEFRSDRSDLIDPNLSWNRQYALYKEDFPRWNDLIVVIDGPPGDADVNALARRIADALAENPIVASADAGFEAAETGPRLFQAAPEPIFTEVLDDLADARRIAASENPNAALATVLGMIREQQANGANDDNADPAAGALPDFINDDADPIARLEETLRPYLAAIRGDEPAFEAWMPDQPHWLPLVSAEGSGRLRFIQVSLARQEGNGVDDVTASLAWLRARIGEIMSEAGQTNLDWGVTGVPAIEADETAQSIRDSTIASIAAFIMITAMMVAVFRGFMVPLLAAGSLLIGIAWSFGWLVLAVGHLQLLSVVFTVILLGLGVDFALHLVARLELVKNEHADLPDATRRVFRGIGPGMLTGAITTAAAFGATTFTEFTGMAEMGLIAAGGIVLCLVAVLSAFPAGLALTGRWKSIIRHRKGGESAHFSKGRFDTIDFHPRVSLAVASVLVLLLVIPALGVRYDPNILNLHPPGIESVEWERRLVEDDARSVWAGLIETNAREAPALVERLRALPEVGGVGGMGLLITDDREERLERIAAVREMPIDPPTMEPGPIQLASLLTGLRVGLTQSIDAAELPPAPLVDLRDSLAATLADFGRLPREEQQSRYDRLAAAFESTRAKLGAWLDEALSPTPLGPDDLPPILRQQWTAGATWLLRVFPAEDSLGRPILHPDRLGPFVAAVRSVAPDLLGPPVQIYESTRLIIRAYTKAAGFAIAAILILLLLDFRSLADALCSMAPVCVGFIGAFGLMGVVGVPLNFANIIVMPLIFGIGVDAGVHMVHRWRVEPDGRPAGLSGGTGRGITLTMLTTMIGFGCMLIAEHRGIRSLGFVMVAGLLVTLLACYTILPAILRLRTEHWTRRVGRNER